MPDPIERKCKECGATLVFAESPNGRPLPLQRIRNVYGVENGKATVLISRVVYVSHFETCTNPSRFSRP